ncbi:MAG: hypothetical protein WDW36_007065 [Sanguina aurantia]
MSGNRFRLAIHPRGVVDQQLARVYVDDRADVGAELARVADGQFGHRASGAAIRASNWADESAIIAFSPFFQRRMAMAAMNSRFHELIDRPRRASLAAIRRNGADQHDQARIDHQVGNFGNAPDILDPVLRCEAEILVDAVTDVVAVQQIRVIAEHVQATFDQVGDGRLTRARQSGEPRKIASGKFQGLMQTNTPRPCRNSWLLSPVGPGNCSGWHARRRVARAIDQDEAAKGGIGGK